ncbi:HD domain-containing protein [Mesorhizobium amorphae]|uniref:HD domain-containing protein n=1 Tax=Mesorhizobium amorphae TaxID=71433 RepID=UPI001300C6D9|nr:HD domain-containing protein [Mesorhizobium amorphae]
MLESIPNTVIRDNIYGARLVNTDKYIRNIIDSIEFQRLRQIRQTGIASYVFPTAEHSRFAHSIGVFATACKVFDHLRERSIDLLIDIPILSFDEDTKREFLAACLCHDVGHTAFSHVLESSFLPDNLSTHEECTKLILRENTEISKKIRDYTDIDAVEYFLDRKHVNKALTSMVSGPFDVDRCDYMLRDSHMTGVVSGNFDFQWLLHSISPEINQLGLPVLTLDGVRGTDALRQFFLSRRYLYRHIYFHPAVRSGQILLKSIFERLRDIGGTSKSRSMIPRLFYPILDRKNFTLGEFLRISDVEVLYLIRLCAEEHPDATLKHLAKMFIERKFPKCVLDSGKLFDRNNIVSRFFETDILKSDQITMFGDDEPNVNNLVEDLKDFLRPKLVSYGISAEVVDYIVSSDKVTFSSSPPSDLMFSYKGKIFGYDTLPKDHDGRNMAPALDSFSLWRVFVPWQFKRECTERMETRYPTLSIGG